MIANSMSASRVSRRAREEYLLLLEERARRQAESLRNDRPAFFAVTQGYEPDPTQVAVMTSTSRYVQLLCCRQWGKSTVAAVIGAHIAIYEPGSLVIVTARGLRQSSELFGKLEKTHAMAPGAPKRVTDSATEIELSNGSRVVCIPGSAETIVGYSKPRAVIIDESARTKDDVYKSVRPMLSRSKDGQLFLLSTAYGKRGHFYDVWSGRRGAWARFGPITGDQVHDAAFLEEERAELGDYWYRQEYGCEFVHEVDAVFDHESIHAALVDDVQPLMGARRAA